ncbi:MAG: lipopolysaccharide assembly protein LapA domain-containing protein [Patescibacteria group bacterium]
MFALVSIVIFGLVFAYFATLNTIPININLGYTLISNVPLYLAILTSLAGGLILAAIIYVGKSLASYFKNESTAHELRKTKNTVTELTKRIHQLELENTKLKAKAEGEPVDEDSL